MEDVAATEALLTPMPALMVQLTTARLLQRAKSSYCNGWRVGFQCLLQGTNLLARRDGEAFCAPGGIDLLLTVVLSTYVYLSTRSTTHWW